MADDTPQRAFGTPVSANQRQPPHPLESRWYLHLENEVYGPYSGYELKSFLTDGRIDASTSVAREGSDVWAKLAEEPKLTALLRPVPPPPAQPQSLTAEKGGTVVQVTNQINPAAFLAFDDGAAGPKSAGLALVLSLLICGGGQMYNGQVAKGVLMLIGCVVLWFILLGWIINIWSWIDAYQTAKRMNARYQRRLMAGLSA